MSTDHQAKACPTLVIAGVHSGVGKTSASLALARAFYRRGIRVQTFKVGPDYLDPTYLAQASQRACYNLDCWMGSATYIQELFWAKTQDADLALIEGVMGLFDGVAPDSDCGSTAEIAHLLKAPVLLVVNAHGIARSIAALVKGFVEFDARLSFLGILANRCGAESHRDWLKASLYSSQLPPLIGAIPRGAFPPLPSRHLGLKTAKPGVELDKVLESLADAVEKHFDPDELLHSLTTSRDAQGLTEDFPCARRLKAVLTSTDGAPLAHQKSSLGEQKIRLGIARDGAFHFYYEDNLQALYERGFELVFFSPLNDERLPEDLDALYLGGGYPEEVAEDLAANKSLMENIRAFANQGQPIYAECGGLMYISQGIESYDDRRFPMIGLLPSWIRMRKQLVHLRYVEVTLIEDTLWGQKGDSLRGHEYHYSDLLSPISPESGWNRVYSVTFRRGQDTICEGYQRERVLASYVHLHFASKPASIDRWFAACQKQPQCQQNSSQDLSQDLRIYPIMRGQRDTH